MPRCHGSRPVTAIPQTETGLAAVMAGLVPAIHVFLAARTEDVDARHIGVRKRAVLRTAMAGHDDTTLVGGAKARSVVCAPEVAAIPLRRTRLSLVISGRPVRAGPGIQKQATRLRLDSGFAPIGAPRNDGVPDESRSPGHRRAKARRSSNGYARR